MLLDLFFTFFKLGLFTFGGGYAMIANIKEIIVERKKWITEDELLEIITIAESTPGPIAINIATYVGYTKKKILGSLMATLAVVLPSFIIIFLISLFFQKFLELKYVLYAFYGINACVSFLICKTGIGLFKKMQKKSLSIIIFSIVFILMIILEILSIKFSSIYLILIGGLIGIMSYSLINKTKGEEQ